MIYNSFFFAQFIIALIAATPIRRLHQLSTTDAILSTFESEIISSTESGSFDGSMSMESSSSFGSDSESESMESTSTEQSDSPGSPESPDSPDSIESSSTPESPESESQSSDSIEECEVDIEDGGAFVAQAQEACSVCVCNGAIAECQNLLDQEITTDIMTAIKNACPSLNNCAAIVVEESTATDFSQGIFPDTCSCDLLECAASADGGDLTSSESSSATNVKYMVAAMTTVAGLVSVLV